jgi:hypothetical protein
MRFLSGQRWPRKNSKIPEVYLEFYDTPSSTGWVRVVGRGHASAVTIDKFRHLALRTFNARSVIIRWPSHCVEVGWRAFLHAEVCVLQVSELANSDTCPRPTTRG